MLFYTTHDAHAIEQINARTAKLEADLWSAVEAAGAAQPTPTIALTVSGMNDVLNARGYTQAAWWNRIPPSGMGFDGSGGDLRQCFVRIYDAPHGKER